MQIYLYQQLMIYGANLTLLNIDRLTKSNLPCLQTYHSNVHRLLELNIVIIQEVEFYINMNLHWNFILISMVFTLVCSDFSASWKTMFSVYFSQTCQLWLTMSWTQSAFYGVQSFKLSTLYLKESYRHTNVTIGIMQRYKMFMPSHYIVSGAILVKYVMSNQL